MKHERGYSTQWQGKTKCKHSQQKKSNNNSCFFFLFFFSFFFCQLWFYMLQSLTTTLIKNLRWFHIMTTNRRYRGGLTCTMRVTVTTKAVRERGQRGSRKQRDKNDFWVMSTLNVSHSHTRLPCPNPPKKHQILGIQMRY